MAYWWIFFCTEQLVERIEVVLEQPGDYQATRQDIFIACVDGLKGFPEAIETIYLLATVQLCIVYMLRNSLNFVGWNKRKIVAADPRRIYTAATIDEAEQNLYAFEVQWNEAYPSIAKSWRNNWSRITPFSIIVLSVASKT